MKKMINIGRYLFQMINLEQYCLLLSIQWIKTIKKIQFGCKELMEQVKAMLHL